MCFGFIFLNSLNTMNKYLIMYKFVRLCVFIYPIIPGKGSLKSSCFSGTTEPVTFSYESPALLLRPTVSRLKRIQMAVVVLFIFVYVMLRATKGSNLARWQSCGRRQFKI
jgi:hypothetical protein